MEKAIVNASEILKEAMEHDRKDALKQILERSQGVAFVKETAPDTAHVKASHHTGVVLAKTKENEWSDPLACELGGTGWGVGGATKDIMVFILTQESKQDFIQSPTGLELQEGLSLAMGTFDNDHNMSTSTNPDGSGAGGPALATPTASTSTTADPASGTKSMVGSHFVSKSDTSSMTLDFLSDFNDGQSAVGTLTLAFTKGTYVSAMANGASIYLCEGQEPKKAEKVLNGVKRSKVHGDSKKVLKEIYRNLDTLSKGQKNKSTTRQEMPKHVPRDAPAAIESIVQETIHTM